MRYPASGGPIPRKSGLHYKCRFVPASIGYLAQVSSQTLVRELGHRGRVRAGVTCESPETEGVLAQHSQEGPMPLSNVTLNVTIGPQHRRLDASVAQRLPPWMTAWATASRRDSIERHGR